MISIPAKSNSFSCAHTYLVRAEADVTKLEDRGEDGPDGGDLISMEANGLKALNQELEILFVLLCPHFTGTTLQEDRQ